LAVRLTKEQGAGGHLTTGLAVLFFAISVVFVWRSFYGMRIGTQRESNAKA
jgi:K(+)-stimulated pyrophosphate-energized sodium pump